MLLTLYPMKNMHQDLPPLPMAGWLFSHIIRSVHRNDFVLLSNTIRCGIPSITR
jgi:hypothetical protein